MIPGMISVLFIYFIAENLILKMQSRISYSETYCGVEGLSYGDFLSKIPIFLLFSVYFF